MAPDATGSGLLTLASSVARDGFAFLRAPHTRALLEAHAGPAGLADWETFAASWNDLSTDTYMADGGRYRRRRHGIFAARQGGPVERQPHAPHFQSRDYNPLNGGIQRWFEPILPVVADGPCMRAILNSCRALFDTLTPSVGWHIEVHQFRIEARARETGQPTPEGMHRDGVDHVLVLMIDRLNIRSGVTSIHDLQGRELGSFTLEQPLDAAWVEDRRVMHGVTPVEAENPALPAHRDVLVATFLAQ